MGEIITGKFYTGNKVIPHNPALAIPNNKVTSPLPDILYESECTRLLNAASADCRTYFLILLLLETGMKIEEVMSLQLHHIDTSNTYAPEVWVKHTGKKIRKDRKLKLPPEIVPAFNDYIAAYHITDRPLAWNSFQRAVQHGAGNPKFLTDFLLRGITLHAF